MKYCCFPELTAAAAILLTLPCLFGSGAAGDLYTALLLTLSSALLLSATGIRPLYLCRVAAAALFLLPAAAAFRGASFFFAAAAAACAGAALLRHERLACHPLFHPLRLLFGVAAAAALLYESCLIPALFRPAPAPRAMWADSDWGVPVPHGTELNIKSQYSYDLLQDFLQATPITDTDSLRNFRELWMITPTRPFSAEERESITRWVRSGGRLVAVCDHTDLFGHATVINPLLQALHAGSVEKNVILDTEESGGRFFGARGRLLGLSACSFRLCGGEAWLFSPGYSERTDYSGRSFFADNRISGEEEPGLFATAADVPCGAGYITMVGDSTAFANFALARPSCQKLLRMTMASGQRFSLSAAVAGLLLLTLLPRRRTRRTALFCGGAGVLTLCLWAAAAPLPDLQLTQRPTCSLSGDPALAEGDGARFGSLFPSAYTMAARFPIWQQSATPNALTVNGRQIFPSLPHAEPPHAANTEKALQELPLPQRLPRLLALCEAQAANSSFWYDDGIGPVREWAHRRFWACWSGTTAEELLCGEPQPLRCRCIMAGRTAWRGTAYISPISRAGKNGGEGWVLIGNSLVGKRLRDGRLLARASWQAPAYAGADLVLLPEESTED